MIFWILILSFFPLQADVCNLNFANFRKEETKKEVITNILSLYPEQSKEMLTIRLKNATDKHKFMRSFIPYYYAHVYDLTDFLPIHKKLKSFKGMIVGDAHVENFGFLINNKGQSVLSLNDFDDVITGPLYLDVMRLSQSASYVDKTLDVSKFLEAYKRGLKNEKHTFSDYTQKLQKQSELKGLSYNEKIFDPKKGLKFLQKESGAEDLTLGDLKQLEKILTQEFGQNIKLGDTYTYSKDSGGSAFSKRYRVLFEVEGTPHFIEFKQIKNSGVLPKLTGRQTENNSKRVLEARDLFLGDDFSEKLRVVKIGEFDFQIRYKYAGHQGVDFNEIAEKEYLDVIVDEFNLLGQLHRKSMDESMINAYIKQMNNLTANDWSESISAIKKRMKNSFDLVNE
jgi:hypothetical protein